MCPRAQTASLCSWAHRCRAARWSQPAGLWCQPVGAPEHSRVCMGGGHPGGSGAGSGQKQSVPGTQPMMGLPPKGPRATKNRDLQASFLKNAVGWGWRSSHRPPQSVGLRGWGVAPDHGKPGPDLTAARKERNCERKFLPQCLYVVFPHVPSAQHLRLQLVSVRTQWDHATGPQPTYPPCAGLSVPALWLCSLSHYALAHSLCVPHSQGRSLICLT